MLNTLRPRAAVVDLSVTLQDVVNKLQRHFDGSLTLSVAGSPVRIVVTDDVIGFDANDVRADAYGLVSMQERPMRARVALTFVAEPGAGTTMVARWSPDIAPEPNELGAHERNSPSP